MATYADFFERGTEVACVYVKQKQVNRFLIGYASMSTTANLRNKIFELVKLSEPSLQTH